jgi:hypothetical protein
MPKKEFQPPLNEYKFHYRDGDSVNLSDKYFMAHDLDEAVNMFEYVCHKRKLETEVAEIMRWNKWSSKWESYDLVELGNDRPELKFKLLDSETSSNRIDFNQLN